MKNTIKLLTMITMVFAATACTPEELRHERDITYTVSDLSDKSEQSTTTVHLTTEAEFDALLDRFCDYALQGSTVTFRNGTQIAMPAGAKAVASYTTSSRDEMKQWMKRMEDEGKTVTVTYDSTTQKWVGTAYATSDPNSK